MEPVDLLEVAKKLDPRFAENMPEEVANAFSEGRVKRLFRTSKDMPSTDTSDMLNKARASGDYGGSIYVELESGQTARWKSPELAAQSDAFSSGASGLDAGWNANKGQSIFSDKSYILGENFKQEFDPLVKDLMSQGILGPTDSTQTRIATATNIMAQRNSANITPINMLTSEQLAGGQIYEQLSAGGHRGHNISEVFDSSGQRHFFAGDVQTQARGLLSSQPIDDFFGNKGMSSISAISTSKPTAIASPRTRPIIKLSGAAPTANVSTGIKSVQEAATRPILKAKSASALRGAEEVAEAVTKGASGAKALRQLGLRRLLG